MVRNSKSTLVDAAQPAGFPSMEFHLKKVGKFFAAEHIHTVFPDCADLVSRHERAGHKVVVCLLFTFQHSKGSLEAATEEELNEERDAFLSAVSPTGKSPNAAMPSSPSSSDTHISNLIGYKPESVVWKDDSRETFFKFMQHTAQAIDTAFAASGDDSAVEPRYFLGYADPATGLPVGSARGASTFTDADAIQQFFPFDSVLVAGVGGGCRMIDHPVYGLSVYPASGVLAFAEEDTTRILDTLSKL